MFPRRARNQPGRRLRDWRNKLLWRTARAPRCSHPRLRLMTACCWPFLTETINGQLTEGVRRRKRRSNSGHRFFSDYALFGKNLALAHKAQVAGWEVGQVGKDRRQIGGTDAEPGR